MDHYYEQCEDCKEEFPETELVQWKGSMFSVMAGDTPTNLCRKCLSGEKHQKRKALDAEDYDDYVKGE